MRPAHHAFRAACLALACLTAPPLFATATASLVGTVRGIQGSPQAGATVRVRSRVASLSATTGTDGSFAFPGLPIGDYTVVASLADEASAPVAVQLGLDAAMRVDLALKPAAPAPEEMAAVTIQAARIRINPSASVSSHELGSRQIAQLPGGATQPLPKLIAATNPGFVQGDFGQIFARGNHANIQYDIDGVQLPDSVDGTFGSAFSVMDIDRMEVITGGLPAEFGDRLAAVVNIVTKSGAYRPGGYLDMNYGSYGTSDPQAAYGGSLDGGRLRYFISGSYSTTQRGLDTPQPASESNQAQGGAAAVHDASTSNTQFAKVDYSLDDADTLSLTAFNDQRMYQIPNYPASFQPTDAFFSPTYTDAFGNVGGAQWTPAGTNDYQFEGTDYALLGWNHRFKNGSDLLLSPYGKVSSVDFLGDPSNDLQAVQSGTLINPVTADSFFEHRTVTDMGAQGDYTDPIARDHLLKTGFQVQASEAHGPVSVEALSTGQAPGQASFSTQGGSDHDYQESGYLQDDWSAVPGRVVVNAGLRLDGIQYHFADGTVSDDGELQPRLGVNYTPWSPDTKFHAYYGKLFQPAPAEDLRDTFAQLDGTTLRPYDIKSEKDDYYEVGVDHQAGPQLISVDSYYKQAVNLLDDTQLLNTALTEPYNYAQGYVYGTEGSISGRFLDHFTDFAGYTYEIAQGSGASGGLFALTPSQQAGLSNAWTYLDHCQMDTANAGLTYSLGGLTVGLTGLYGSGLRTGPGNVNSLPPHFTMDATASYAFRGDWLEDVKLQLDVTNLTDNIYPIFVDNGFNGSHYAEPRAFLVHVIKTL